VDDPAEEERRHRRQVREAREYLSVAVGAYTVRRLPGRGRWVVTDAAGVERYGCAARSVAVRWALYATWGHRARETKETEGTGR
jgi:hypothetical protein